MKSLYIILLFLCSSFLLAQETTETLYDKTIKPITASKTIKVSVSNAGSAQNSAVVTAKRGNKFVLEMADRTIICNAKDIWNYDKQRKAVSISAFNPNANSLSVEKVFFEVLSAYKATQFQKQNNSSTGSAYILTLTPNGKPISGAQSITLTIDATTYSIKKVVVVAQQGKQEWNVLSLQLNPKIKDTLFNFKVPKGVEVVDMR